MGLIQEGLAADASVAEVRRAVRSQGLSVGVASWDKFVDTTGFRRLNGGPFHFKSANVW